MNTTLRFSNLCSLLNSYAAITLIVVIAILGSTANSRAADTLAYSFENDLQGFTGNGGGITLTQDTVGATEGTHSMRIDMVAGAFFSGPLTGQLDPTLFYPPPGIDHVLFDLTITQRYDHPDLPNPGFADLGVTIFGVAQIGGAPIQAQTGASSQLPIGPLEAGTYHDMRINLDKLGNNYDFTTRSYNNTFGAPGSSADMVPTGFEIYINKSQTDPLTIYIDNIRFGLSPPPVAADYNGNGVVDMADYVLWRNGGPLQNEVADVGTVTANDYTAWRAAFGNTSGSGSGSGLGSAAVPEPTTGMLLLVAMGVLPGARRKHAIN